MVARFDFTTTATCDPGVPSGTCSKAPYQHCTTVDDCVLADRICPPGATDDRGCYHQYDTSDRPYQPAHLVVDPADGAVWYANYFFGSDLARLDPETGGVTVLPLTQPPYSPPRAPLTDILEVVSWPWDVKMAPNGDVVATEYGVDRIARVRATMVGDPACERLRSPTGQTAPGAATLDETTSPPTFIMEGAQYTNPCVAEDLVPGSWERGSTVPGFTHRPIQALLTVAFDARRNVWFDQGYHRARGHRIVLLPPLLALYPTRFTADREPDMHSGIGGGVAIDLATGDIWGADYVGRRLGRLRKTS
jgi:hypothetical protein